MATESTVLEHDIHADGDAWSGAKAPFKASYGKLMMWYFLLSDAFTFAGFLIAYGALRFSVPTWPVPDFVFASFPGVSAHWPLIFVTVMTFVLIASSVTMVRAVQEGARENKNGVVFWMVLTIIGGAAFLGCQAFEWATLIGKEHMTVTTNPFGTHTESGVYLNEDGSESSETFHPGSSFLLHKAGAHHGAAAEHGEDHGDAHAAEATAPGDYKGYVIDEKGFKLRKFKITEGERAGTVMTESYGPKAFGALFYFITGFHGFHVFSGVMFLTIIAINAASGLYVKRRNGYEMVEKMGLYWHFVDLVWVFVFLVFYLL